MGACLLSEANDLKRPLPIVAKEQFIVPISSALLSFSSLQELNVSLERLECRLGSMARQKDTAACVFLCQGLMKGNLEVSDALDIVRKMSEAS